MRRLDAALLFLPLVVMQFDLATTLILGLRAPARTEREARKYASAARSGRPDFWCRFV